jgi:4-amino-4-deoxychorismate lyase
MSLLIESIKLTDGKFCNLFYHEQRMIRSLDNVCGVEEDINLEKLLGKLDVPQKGLFKCRIVYDEVSKTVEFIPYSPKEIRSLKIVEHDRISYEHKYADREAIDKLYQQKEDCDDILIVKKGNITDASYANIVFRKGKTWYTPWSALLKGTMRQNLIENNKILTENIQIEDLKTFKTFKLITAMLEFDSPEIDVSNIVL